jgi:hypothetical protein
MQSVPKYHLDLYAAIKSNNFNGVARLLKKFNSQDDYYFEEKISFLTLAVLEGKLKLEIIKIHIKVLKLRFYLNRKC